MGVKQRFLVFAVFAMMAGTCVAGDPVPLPCDPKDCPPIDPCKLAPERCKPPGGGPLSDSGAKPMKASTDTDQKKEDKPTAK